MEQEAFQSFTGVDGRANSEAVLKETFDTGLVQLECTRHFLEHCRELLKLL